MSEKVTEIELPPLPCPELSMPLHGKPSVYLYTAEQVHEAQRAAVEADRNKRSALSMQAKQEPFGYVLITGHGNSFRESLDGVHPELRHLWKPVYLYAAPVQQAEHLTWIDQWDCTHTMTLSAATEFLKEFLDEWPGGMGEIEACISMWKKQAEQKEAKLIEAIKFIRVAPHGDNCFVSDHYEGDPGNRCNCGKDSLLEWLEGDDKSLTVQEQSKEGGDA